LVARSNTNLQQFIVIVMMLLQWSFVIDTLNPEVLSVRASI